MTAARGIRTHLLRPVDGAWDRWLVGPHDVYHTAGYHRFAEESDEGTAWLAVVEDGRRSLAWPYLLRPIASDFGRAWAGRTDVTSVYGYPGPVVAGTAPGEAFPDEAQSLYKMYAESYATGQNLVNLKLVAALGD